MKPNKILRWWCNNNTRYSTKSAWILWSPLEKKLQCSILVESFYLQAFSSFRNSVFTWWKEVFHGVPQKNELTNSVFTWWKEMFHGVPKEMNSQIVCSPCGTKCSLEFPKQMNSQIVCSPGGTKCSMEFPKNWTHNFLKLQQTWKQFNYRVRNLPSY